MTGSEFRDKVLGLLRKRSEDLKLEAIARGSNVSIHWLKKFKQGAIGDPSVVAIVNLYNFLSDKKFEV